MRFRDLKLRAAISLGLLAGLLLPVGATSWYYLSIYGDELRRHQRDEGTRLVETVALAVEDHLWNLLPAEGLKPLLAAFMSNPSLVRIEVLSAVSGPYLAAADEHRRQGPTQVLARDIFHGGRLIGRAILEYSDQPLAERVAAEHWRIALTTLAQMVVGVGLLILILGKKVLRPLDRLLQQSHQLRDRQLRQPFEWDQGDELGDLGRGLEATRKALLGLIGDLENSNSRLRSSEHRYRALADLLPVCVLLHDETTILYANPAAGRILAGSDSGSTAALVGRCYLDLVAPEDLGAARDRLKAVAVRREAVGFAQRRLITLTGRMIEAMEAANPLQQEGRSYAVIVVEDVTDRNRAERERRRMATLLRDAVDSLRDGFALFDADQRLVLCNHAYSSFHGRMPEDMAGLHLGEISALSVARVRMVDGKPVTDGSVLGGAVSDASRTGMPIEFETHDNRAFLVTGHRTSDGGAVFVRTNITVLKHAASAIRRSAAQAELIEAIPFPLLLTRRSDDRILHLNESAAQLLGVDLAQVIGLTATEFHSDDQVRALLLARLDQEGRVDGIEVALQPRGGEPFWAAMAARRFIYQGEHCVLAGYLDISERRRLEGGLRRARDDAESALGELRRTQDELVQAEKLASLGGLVAGVAHEINTPMGVALTGASFLNELTDSIQTTFSTGKVTKSEFQSYLEQAKTSAQLILSNLARAVELIQSFKQIAADQTSDVRRSFLLKEYLDEVVTSLSPRFRRSPLKIEISCPEGIQLDGYPGALSQVVTNFLTNSLVHAYQPGQAGILRLTVTAIDDDRLELVYSDNGCGIPPEHLKRVFDPFFTTRRGEGGTGLGLHIVYNIVTKLLGGTIAVDSAPGQGTRFQVRIPRVAPAYDGHGAAI